MPNDKELRQLARTLKKTLKADQNRPYRMRRVKGEATSRGSIEYETFLLNNIRTQPLAPQELDRMEEGLRHRTWRFIQVLKPEPTETWLKHGDQILYKSDWYEVKKIEDWDVIQSANMVHVA